MSDTITVKVHRVSGFEAGQEILIEVDSEGIPLDRFWRRRLRDSKRDQCCEVVVHHGQIQKPQVDRGLDEEPES